jgi:small subunit ribosomal protein S9
MATKTDTPRYIETIGRRKTATARARMTPGTKSSIVINDKDVTKYFDTTELQATAMAPFLKLGLETQFEVTVIVRGGGISGQAVAVRHAIARALNEYDINLRPVLKQEGFLKRDQRSVERKKAGFVKARKRKQWSKR